MVMEMQNGLNIYDFEIGKGEKTAFINETGVYQDGNVPLYRDADGKLWGISGHSHLGHIGIFCGTSLDDMTELYAANTLFEIGHKDVAFSGIPYPEGFPRAAASGLSGCIYALILINFSAFFITRRVGTDGAAPMTLTGNAKSRITIPISGI